MVLLEFTYGPRWQFRTMLMDGQTYVSYWPSRIPLDSLVASR